VQAYFDGEVDAVTAADIERHLESCVSCRAYYQELKQLRIALHQDAPQVYAPASLRASVLHALDKESLPATSALPRSRWGSGARKSFWLGAASGLGTAAVAAVLVFLFLAPPSPSPVVNELLSAHISSLMSTHLVDVVSTDQHTVKPWFAGRADVSPLVADFDAQGYRLEGGRVDYVDHQRAAVLIYQHGPHVINVFSWAADSRWLPDRLTRKGYHMAFWKSGDLEYCAVSDTAWSELLGLTQLLKDLAARDGR
jgi:anti-sigma factor RsiW